MEGLVLKPISSLANSREDLRFFSMNSSPLLHELLQPSIQNKQYE